MWGERAGCRGHRQVEDPKYLSSPFCFVSLGFRGMSVALRSCVRRCGIIQPSRTIQVATCRNFRSSSRHQVALAVPNTGIRDVSTQSRNPREILESQKLKDLLELLARNPSNPNCVWGCYVDLLNLVRPDKVPLEVHQKVLRRCTLPARETRAEFARRLMTGNRPRLSHIHELRFQSIIHSIREAGYIPSLDDYNFVLEQFAAVGHHLGAVRVLEEITYYGLSKTPKTYGLCLQALCHRLQLPCWHEHRPLLLTETSRICMQLLTEMWASDVPFTSVNVDLCIRVLKETLDQDVLERLLKFAYGVDLTFPDRPPLEFWDQDRVKAAPKEGDVISYLPGPQPFSTAALNTTIDILGRLGNVSKLVQTFEVLTTPLPSHAPAVPASSFYDDEDDDFGFNSPSVAPHSHPYATPNSTTYYLLIKWVSTAGNATLARHYLLQAMAHDRATDRRLRGDCLLKPRQEIPAIHFAVNRSMILPVFHEANRDKNMGLMWWVLGRTRRVLRRKRFDIVYYTAIREIWKADAAAEALMPDTVDDGPNGALKAPTPQPVASTITTSGGEGDLPPMPHFDVDLDAPASSAPQPEKIFDIDFHLSVLLRDKSALEEFEKRVRDVIGRTTQRVKERLGRRVWGDKDVFLRTQNRRTRLTRDVWREVVNFNPEKVAMGRSTRIRKSLQNEAPNLSSEHTARRPEIPTSSPGV